MSDEIKAKHDDFTAKVVADPAQPQETLLLQGFLGASSQPDHTRVYSDITLESYVDVANADIIYIEPMPKEQSPMGGSYVWIKKDADVQAGTKAGEATAKAKFLQGPISAEAAQVAVPVQPAQTLPLRTVPIVACHPSILVRACPTPVPRCVVQTPVCPTRPVVCEIVASGTGPCHIPDPTIHEQTIVGQFQQHAAPAPPIGATVLPAACPPPPTSLCPTPRHICPSQVCPTPHNQCPTVNQFHCPSVAGFDCPTVNRFHCPSVNGFDCPSVNEFHCPSVNNFHCPPKTTIAADCPPTPNIQHCPTPNHICPLPSINCPSFADVCQTAGPHLC